MLPKEPGLEMDFTLESEKTGIVNEPAFQLLLLGNWSSDPGRRNLSSRKPIEVDRDNLDDVMRGLDVNIELDCDGIQIGVEFDSIESFHPDELLRRLPIFGELRGLRKRLRDPQTFNSAAREMRAAGLASEREESEILDDNKPAAEGGGLLESILANPEGGSSVPKQQISGDLARLVEQVVRLHLTGVDEDEQSAMIAAVDRAIATLMRTILHNRRFQELEAAWRGLFFLVRRVETSSDLRIFILDVSKAEVFEDVKDAERSILKSTLMKGHNGDPWAAAFGNYGFEGGVDDIAALIRIGKVAASCRTPFISHIMPDILGIASLAEEPDPDAWDLTGQSAVGKLWTAVRGLLEAKFIGMTMPRFLSRLPYGSATEPAETFSFEEFEEGVNPNKLVWSNGCFVAAQLLAASYSHFGWDFGEQYVQDVEGLPMYVFRQDGATVQQSSAEVQLSQSAAERLMDLGIMPLVSFKDTDRIRLVRLQSISEPLTRLEGRWG